MLDARRRLFCTVYVEGRALLPAVTEPGALSVTESGLGGGGPALQVPEIGSG